MGGTANALSFKRHARQSNYLPIGIPKNTFLLFIFRCFHSGCDLRLDVYHRYLVADLDDIES